MARWKRFLLFGCLSVFILFLVVLGVAYFQMTKKVPIQMDRQIAHPDATVYARVYVSDDSTVGGQLVEDLLSDLIMTYVNSQEYPEGFEGEQVSKYDVEEMRRTLKRVVPAILEFNRFEDEAFSVRLTASGFGNTQYLLWKFFLSSAPDEAKEKYKEHTLLGTDGNNVVTYANGDFLFSKNTETIKEALDQLDQPETLIENAPLADINTDSPFFGFARTPILFLMVEPNEEELTALSDLERTAWSTTIINEKSATLTMLVDVTQSPIAQSYLEKLMETPDNAWRGTVETREGGYQLNVQIDNVSTFSQYLGKLLAQGTDATEEHDYE